MDDQEQNIETPGPRISTVKVRFPKDFAYPGGTRVWIDGNEIEMVNEVAIRHSAGAIREIQIKMYANLEVITDPLPDDEARFRRRFKDDIARGQELQRELNNNDTN